MAMLSFTDRLYRKRRALGGVTGDLLIFAVATAGTYAAQTIDRPITAVLAYLVGVILVGARSGLARGVAAAVTASLVYNFFLSEPVFRFGATSADEYVPLIAFNASAILTGALAGQLKDRARLARAAEAKSASLLMLSDRLQRAIEISDVMHIARDSLPFDRITNLEIYLLRGGNLYPAGGGDHPLDLSQTLLPDFAENGIGQLSRAYMLNGSKGEIGVVKFDLGSRGGEADDLPDLQGVANILGLAVDRCILLDQLSESQALQKSEELKTAILSSVSHDLRTPLTAIEAAATSLRSFQATLSASQRNEMLATITEQCAKLNRYTANLLDMGRIQSGIPTYMFTDIDLVEILGVVLGSVRHSFPGQPIEKRIDLEQAVIHANPAMLEQVIFNLVENAIVHGASIHPVTIRLTRDGDSCVLEIIDRGPGIAEDAKPYVFNRFYRSRSAAHRHGNGLGLHIAHGFTEAFGGTIAIDSPYGDEGGTRMALSLPLAHTVRERFGAWE